VEAKAGISPINRVLSFIPKRAEGRQIDQLRETFVDSGVAAALESIDHQVLYGRRGTGKTHAFRYLQTVVESRGDISFYADLRTIGSPEGLFMGEVVEPTERGARLLVDLLGQFHDAVLAAVVEDADLIGDNNFVTKLDAIGAAISSMRITGGGVEVSREEETAIATSKGAGLDVGAAGGVPTAGLRLESEDSANDRKLVKESRKGDEKRSLNFSQVARALRELAGSLTSRRIWFLLDEWSSVPPEVQP
jgi:hypothetical protein